jgi:hypothetical protein
VVEARDIVKLQNIFCSEAAGRTIGLNLQEIAPMDRDTVKFLAWCESESIKPENCPAFICQWIDPEREGSSQK